jgi:hypothetical protein
MTKENSVTMNKRMGLFGALVCAATMLLLGAGSALAAAPAWDVQTIADSSAAPGSQLTFYVQTVNKGDADATGSEEELSVTLPTGMTAVSAQGLHPFTAFIACTAGDGISPVVGAVTVECKDPHPVPDARDAGPGGDFVAYKITVAIDPGVPSQSALVARFEAAGGGAATARAVDPTKITSAAPGFGIDAFDGFISADAEGDLSTQAGDTPYADTTAIDFNVEHTSNPLIFDATPVEPAKDVAVSLPAGFVGVPAGTPQCTGAQLAEGGAGGTVKCPVASQVGTTGVHLLSMTALNFPETFHVMSGPIPLYNMVPPPGVPARFGFNFLGTVVVLDAKLSGGPDYHLSVVSHNVSEGLGIDGTTVTFWGVPADPSHDADRACPGLGGPWWGAPSGADPVNCVDAEGHPFYTRPPITSFLRNPTSCTGPLTTTVAIDSWVHPGALTADGAPDLSDPNWRTASLESHNMPGYPNLTGEWGSAQGMTGCGAVPFDPAVSVQPTSTAADGPTGLDVSLALPQTNDPSSINEADLKRFSLVLPQGMTLNPSSANGLGACSEAQIALTSSAPPTCPDSAKLGTVEVETPLLDHKVPGAVYLATQTANPFGSLLAMYIVLDDPASGTVIKLPAKIEADPSTGQLTTTLDQNPQLPFSSFKLHFFDGPTAALAAPLTCGTRINETTLASWANPTLDVHREDVFNVSGACASSEGAAPFAPTFTGGTVDNQAGKFSPLVISFSRADGEQRLGSLNTSLPVGAEAILAGVPLCSDADAAAGSCPAASQIGSVTVQSGVGSSPFSLKGQVYLTGPYNGGPYGEVVVVPAIAGPLNLGNVVVRGSIRIDPHTAQASVVSDPFPTMVNQTGIPADVRRVDVALDRPGFSFNPTSCNPLSMGGALTSAQGASVPVSSRFQAAGCSSLPFHPAFSASTQGNGKLGGNGASLFVKIAAKSGPGAKAGTEEANIKGAEVQLPTVLPSRLSTLQKACTEAQFATNPAGCPVASNVGTAVASTPVLGAPLSGPAYLVSHGGAAFPDLVLVLQGNGVTIDLVGHTLIKGKTTYSKFDTVPDAPISSFELRLPEGPHSALAASTGLCKVKTVTTSKRAARRVHGRVVHVLVKSKRNVVQPLVMPTTLTGQNGVVFKQATKVAVTGCPKAKAPKAKAQKHKRGKKR